VEVVDEDMVAVDWTDRAEDGNGCRDGLPRGKRVEGFSQQWSNRKRQ